MLIPSSGSITFLSTSDTRSRSSTASGSVRGGPSGSGAGGSAGGATSSTGGGSPHGARYSAGGGSSHQALASSLISALPVPSVRRCVLSYARPPKRKRGGR